MHITDHDALAAALAGNAPFVPLYGELDPEILSTAGLMDAAVAAKRLVAHAEAFQARVFARAERVIRAQDAGSSRGRAAIESELGASLHLPPATLRTLLAESGSLCERFPETFALLSAGTVSWRQIKPLLDLTSCMSQAHARTVQQVVVGKMPQQSARTTYNQVQAAIHQADPEGAAERHAQRHLQRHLQVHPDIDGMATLRVYLKAQVALAVLAKVNATCRKRTKGDPRTLDQRRADTLTEMILTGDPTGGGTTPAAMVHVVVNVESLLGLDDTPAQLEGYGPITPAQARALTTAPGSQMRRLFVDAGGKLLRVDPHQYRPGAQLDRFLRLRERHCSFKGCTMPARRCDLDHMHAFAEGGCTCEQNLHPACRRHHQEKTAGLWSVHREGDAIVWTSTTTGRRYVSHPEPYPVAANDHRRARPRFSPPT